MIKWIINNSDDLSKLALYSYDKIVHPSIAYQDVLSSKTALAQLRDFIASHKSFIPHNYLIASQVFSEISQDEILSIVRSAGAIWKNDPKQLYRRIPAYFFILGDGS